MSVWRTIVCVASFVFSATASGGESALPFGNDEACMKGPLAQFGRYIGDWKIEDAQLAQDGSGWSEGDGARWIFRCLGDGVAIQDFWLPPDGKVGTNLRTYEPETGTWEIAWMIDQQAAFSHIRAAEDEAGNIVMHYVSPLPNPLRRITFYPPDEAGWDWTLEFSSDEGETWLEVYKIRATPYE